MKVLFHRLFENLQKSTARFLSTCSIEIVMKYYQKSKFLPKRVKKNIRALLLWSFKDSNLSSLFPFMTIDAILSFFETFRETMFFRFAIIPEIMIFNYNLILSINENYLRNNSVSLISCYYWNIKYEGYSFYIIFVSVFENFKFSYWKQI